MENFNQSEDVTASESGQNTTPPRFYDCPGYLEVS